VERVIVIGAGLGGLAAACRLAKDGRRVTVIERNEAPGGKVNLVESGGFRFDTGASLLTMPQVFEELFSYCGRDLSAYLDLVELDPICRYSWQDGTALDTSANIEDTAEGIASISPADADEFRHYLRKSREKYEIAERTFLSRSLNELPQLLRPANLPDLFRISTLSTLAGYNARHFESPKIRQLFDRYATYNGSSPFSAPATFALIPWVEFGLGAWYPKGGIYQIPSALRKLAEEMGAEFRLGEDVKEIVVHNGRAAGVRLDAETLEADAVVCNADAVWIRPPSRYFEEVQPARPPQHILLGRLQSGVRGDLS